MKFNYPF